MSSLIENSVLYKLVNYGSVMNYGTKLRLSVEIGFGKGWFITYRQRAIILIITRYMYIILEVGA